MEMSKPGGVMSQDMVLQPTFPLKGTRIDQKYSIVQTATPNQTISSSNAGPSFAYVNFTLSLLDQVSSLTAVFDQYRIKLVEVSFRPRMTFESSASANTGQFITVVDVDDSAVLSSMAQAADYQTALIGRGLDSQRRVFIPHCAIAAYGAGTFTSYANVASPWIDCSSTGVVHYGLKTAWSQTDSVYSIDFTVRVSADFRNVR
jgi:hypothetical protein